MLTAQNWKNSNNAAWHLYVSGFQWPITQSPEHLYWLADASIDQLVYRVNPRKITEFIDQIKPLTKV